MNRKHAIHGLYAITDAALQAPAALPGRVDRALAGGARIIQYRDKGGDQARRRREAEQLLARCRAHGAVFIVNDDVELTLACGGDGVHLGRDDVTPDEARRRLGPGCLIGVSCYNDLDRARRLAAAGADYLAFGSVFASVTKPHAPRAGLAVIRQARELFPRLPLVGIGGIDAGNAPAAVAAGLDAVAVIRAVFDAPDPAEPAAAIAAAFSGSGGGRPGDYSRAEQE